jgi:hypothetical protein
LRKKRGCVAAARGAAVLVSLPCIPARSCAPALFGIGFFRFSCWVFHPLGFSPGSILKARIGAVAQLGERLLCKQEVVGSIPSGSTTGRLLRLVL